MIKISSSKEGSIVVTVIFIIMMSLFIYKQYFASDEIVEQSQVVVENDEEVDADENTPKLDVTSLMTKFGYSGSGKATRIYENGEYELNLSVVLPALSEGGYYEAFLEGPSTINLGRLQKQGTTLKLKYTSFQNLTFHNDIRITVNGADFTVEKNSRTLPFDIMEGSF